MQLFMNVLLLQTSKDVLHQYKNPQATQTSLYSSLLVCHKGCYSSLQRIIHTVHSILVAEGKNIVCSKGLKEYAKMHVHI